MPRLGVCSGARIVGLAWPRVERSTRGLRGHLEVVGLRAGVYRPVPVVEQAAGEGDALRRDRAVSEQPPAERFELGPREQAPCAGTPASAS